MICFGPEIDLKIATPLAENDLWRLRQTIAPYGDE